MTRVLLIANPAAGRQALDRIERAQTCLRELGAEVELVLTRGRGDARRAAAGARQEEVDRVIAAGGDGTLNEVINGLVPTPIPLAFIPLGTTNVFAIETGIPFLLEDACRIALEAPARPVCTGIAGDRYFLLMAGIGFDAEVVYGINLRLKRWIGKLAYVVGGLSAWMQRPPAIVEVEDESGAVHRGYGAIVGNARLYAGRFTLTPEASLLEDRLDLCLFLKPGRLSLLRQIAATAAGRSPGPPGVRCLQGRRFAIRGQRVPVQIDGDYLGMLPLEFRTTFGELSLVLPEDFGKKSP